MHFAVYFPTPFTSKWRKWRDVFNQSQSVPKEKPLKLFTFPQTPITLQTQLKIPLIIFFWCRQQKLLRSQIRLFKISLCSDRLFKWFIIKPFTPRWRIFHPYNLSRRNSISFVLFFLSPFPCAFHRRVCFKPFFNFFLFPVCPNIFISIIILSKLLEWYKGRWKFELATAQFLSRGFKKLVMV